MRRSRHARQGLWGKGGIDRGWRAFLQPCGANEYLACDDADAAWISVREGHALELLCAAAIRLVCRGGGSGGCHKGLSSSGFQTGVIVQDDFVDIMDFSILAADWNDPIHALPQHPPEALGSWKDFGRRNGRLMRRSGWTIIHTRVQSGRD